VADLNVGQRISEEFKGQLKRFSGRLDRAGTKANLQFMPLTQDKTAFARQLRKNPQLTPPALPKTALTVAKLHRYKERSRSLRDS
jgi:hypothetical protein